MAIRKNRVTYKLNLREALEDVPRNKRKEAKEAVADFIVSMIKEDTLNSKSPVDGSRFRGLSKEYKAFKRKITGSSKADLHLTNSMMDNLETRIKGNVLEVGIFNRQEAPKAFNHNVGDTLAKRQFIPDRDEKFRSSIRRGVKDIISGFEADLTQEEQKVFDAVREDLSGKIFGEAEPQGSVTAKVGTKSEVGDVLDDLGFSSRTQNLILGRLFDATEDTE